MALLDPTAWRKSGVSDAPAARGSAGPDLAHWQSTQDALFSLAVHEGDRFVFEAFNPAAERMTGRNAVDFIGKTPAESMPPAEAALISTRYQQCVTEGRAITYLETLDFPSGRSDWRTSLEPVRDEAGRIIRILGRAQPLTNPDVTPEDLTEGEFRKALDIFPFGIALLDEDGVMLYVNRTWRAFGRSLDRISGAEVGYRYIDLAGTPEGAGLPEGAAVAEKLGQLLKGHLDHFGHAYRWADRHFVLRATRLRLNGRVRVTMAHQDVSDIVEARRQAAQAMELALQAQEEERVRIALEVHDATSQHLVALSLSLARLRDSNAPPAVLADMRHSLAEAQREIRALAYLLYPPKLSSQGLAAALNSFLEGFAKRTALGVETSIGGALETLAPDLQQTVLRIVQEALANVHRHAADARQVSVKVKLKERGLRVRIVDDGHFTGRDAERASGVGIRGMQARFAQFGGELTVTLGPEGAVVDGFLPRDRLVPASPASGPPASA